MEKQLRQLASQENGYNKQNGRHGHQENGYQVRVATGGGTFDTLHLGHQHYLRTAFEHADRVVLYVSSDEYAKAKKVYEVRPYHLRVRRLESFIINKLRINRDRYEIRQLSTLAQVKNDLLKEDIHIALVVPEYYALLRRINKERMDNGKKGILILVKERTRDHKNGDLSSTAIHQSLVKRPQNSSDDHTRTLFFKESRGQGMASIKHRMKMHNS
jgi:pantetheine-phosphate adenylyltransferase